MIYLFDKSQKLIGFLNEKEELTKAQLTLKINEAATLDLEVPAKPNYLSELENVKYVAVPYPDDNEKLLFLQVMTRTDEQDTVSLMAKEYAFQELATSGYIEDKRYTDADARTLMNGALSGSGYTLNNVNVSGSSTTNFYYIDYLTAISNVIDLLEGEIKFYVTVDGNKISGKYVDYVIARGVNTSKVFAYGSNLISIERQSDASSVYTAILPRGKGEAVSQDDGTPDGYGRRINIADVVWKKPTNKLDKPAGSLVLEDPTATAAFGQANGTARLLLKTYDDIEDKNELINAAYRDLLKNNHPAVQFKATVANIGESGLGDTIVIMHSERGMSYRTRIFQIEYDLIEINNTVATFGENLSKNNITSMVSSVSKAAEKAKEIATNAVVSANSINDNYYGETAPTNPKEGDTWFYKEGETFGIRRYINGQWVEYTNTNTSQKIAEQVDAAISNAKEYADNLNKNQANATNSLANELTNKANSLSASQQKIASQASAYTDSAVASANANATALAQSTAQNAQSALSAAKTDLTNSIASQASQTASMASEASSKASQYASQAKSEAIDAATTADGVIRTDFKKTTDSMTATIQQNKSDADGKISTAQTTATQALDGLATKVSQTEYNTKTGQLQTDLTTTTQTANQAATDIVSIKQKDGEQDEKMNSIVSDVNGTKQTVSDLQTIQGKQSGDISALQQRADGFEATVTKVDNLDVGGRNLLLGTSASFNGIGNNSTNGNFDDQGGKFYLAGGKKVSDLYNQYGSSGYLTLSFDWVASGSAISGQFFPQWNNTPWRGKFDDEVINISSTNTSGRYEYTVPLASSGYSTGEATGIAFRQDNLQGNVTISNLKLEAGNVATDWSPAPEDVSNATAKAQLTADNATLAINKYKTDADGRISKAQADIKVNADAITQKVSQSDYNTKTGELTKSVNKAQQTADTATQTIGTYKQTNDKRVAAAETNIKANSDAIALTVSKTDFDKATGKLSGDISTLQQRADGFEATVTKVNNLDVGGRNLLLGTKNWTDNTRWNKRNATITSDMYKNVVIASSTLAWSSPMYYISNASILQVGKTYTFSTYVRNTSDTDTKVGSYYDYAIVTPNGRDYTISLPAHTDWTRVSTTFKVLKDPTTSTAGLRWESQNDLINGFIQFAGYKLEEGNVATDWTPAPEDIDTQLAQVKITADGVYQTVNDPKTGLNTRVSTAEGNINTIKSNVDGMSNTVTETADGLTREISDRQTGDINTLQAGKDFTTSQIKSYDTGMQSQISQMSDGILATVATTNLVIDSSLISQLDNWRYGRGSRKWYYSGNSSYKSVNSIGFNSTGNAGAYNEIFSQPIDVGSFAGSVLYTSVDVRLPRIGGTDTDYLIVYLLEEDATGKVIKYNSISGKLSSEFLNWTNYRSKITLDTTTKKVYLSYQFRGDGNAYVSRPYVGTTELPTGGYTPGTPNNNTTVLALLKDNWKIGIADNIGLITSGIVGDSNSINLISKSVTIDSPNTQINGTAWITNAMLGNASVSTANIGDLAVTSAKISELDVNKLSGNITNFIKSYWSNAYQNLQIDANAIDFTATSSRTKIENGALTLWQNAGGYYRLGGLKTLKGTSGGENNHTAGVYLSLDEWQTTKSGDKYWNYGGSDFFGGSEIGFSHSTGVDGNGNPVYGALMKWSNSLAAGRQAGVSKGFNFFDDINFQGHYFLVNGAANKMKLTWVSWSDWGNYHNIALTNESAKAGIAMNDDNLVLFGVGKRADALTGWKA